jgi:hypothetical protein
LTKKD